MPSARAVAGFRWIALACALTAIGCSQTDDCKRHCKRVALCKREARGGELILGEKPPPADPDCLHRCQTQPDAFAKCEGAKRTCEAMRDCYGSYRD